MNRKPKKQTAPAGQTGPHVSTLKKLFSVSMNRCAFPGCDTEFVDAKTNTLLAEVCHINAQSEKGPRFDPSLTARQVHGFENLILMCGVHHKVIDSPENISTYTVTALHELKASHEDAARQAGDDKRSLSIEQAKALMQQSYTYEKDATHMDFRQAIFRVGGEGGHFGGGGGSGGVLTIVGSHRLPPDVSPELNGRNATGPGGGGGGGGAVRFVGRGIDEREIETGFSISSIFVATAATVPGFFNVLEGGWAHCLCNEIPTAASLRLLFVVELGSVAEEALIRLRISVRNPSGTIALVDDCDVAGLPDVDKTPRRAFARVLNFTVDEPGIWNFEISSADIVLASHKLEFRTK